ncbi:ribonucleoside-diphosphate reductase large subunit, partial [Trichonephila clavata]
AIALIYCVYKLLKVFSEFRDMLSRVLDNFLRNGSIIKNSHYVNISNIAKKVKNGLAPNMKMSEIYNLGAEVCASMITAHSDHAVLAGRIAIYVLHKDTSNTFSDVIGILHTNINAKTKEHEPIVSEELFNVVMDNADRLNSAIDYQRDYNYTYFGFKTLERSYLLKYHGKVVERPQHMLMRVAVSLHLDNIDKAIETYHLMSEKHFIHASPTLFNAGTVKPQMSSCFILDMESDSIEGIYNTLKRCAVISKHAGGIGLNVNKIRASGSLISANDGIASGIVPMLRVFNNTARAIGQGGNKRPAAFTIYLEPWHADIFEFIDLKKNTGKEELRARDLFFALWIPDLFMERVQQGATWSLMCPHECPGLQDCWGEEFEQLYTAYEKDCMYKRQVNARELWCAIVESQIETGNPFMLYKDTCNRKSNQCHLGTIRGSNLCTEVIEYSAPDEIAVCNLASIALNKFVKNKAFNLEKLREITKIVAYNLNKVIDINYYPIHEAEKSNKRHRPIGIGVQGLADAFLLMRYPFDWPEAQKLNVEIFETIYFSALEASCELAKEKGPYENFEGSPASRGILQYDMWDVTPTEKWDWKSLKERISRYGLRNSLLVAPMPTASTSQLLGNNESIEPYTSNIYVRRIMCGDFQLFNSHLLKDLIDLDLWTNEMRNQIIADRGSVQNIKSIPKAVKQLYRTVWEIPQKNLLKMAADRGPFIDQSQSLNVYLAEPTFARITSMHFYGWKLGLKTGMYYLRTQPAANPIPFTVDKIYLKKRSSTSPDIDACSSCSS